MRQAVRLFSRHGYDGVGVQEICDASGITKPTLYHHFGSKRGLVEAVLAEYGGRLAGIVEERAAYAGDIVMSVTEVVEALLDFAEAEPDFYRMLLTMWFAPPDAEYSGAVGELLGRQQELLEAMFRSAVPQHGNMRGRHRQYAVSLRGTVDTYIGLKLQGKGTVSRDTVHRVVHQYLHGVFS